MPKLYAAGERNGEGVVSVDFYAVMTNPVVVGDLMGSAESILAELVGLDEPPDDLVVVRTKRHMGQIVGEGLPLSAEQLASLLIGPGAPDPGIEVFDEDGWDLVQLVASPSSTSWILVVSPRTTARGIVTGLSIALAVALLGDGQVIDNDLRLTDGYETDMVGFIAKTRRQERSTSLSDACLAYLRQFPKTQSWPPA